MLEGRDTTTAIFPDADCKATPPSKCQYLPHRQMQGHLIWYTGLPIADIFECICGGAREPEATGAPGERGEL